MQNLEYYLKELTRHKVDYNETQLVDWLNDVSYLLCENIKVPTIAYTYRIQEEERILARTLFTVKQLYEQPDYVSMDLTKLFNPDPENKRYINPEYMAMRMRSGDDNPFKLIQEKR